MIVYVVILAQLSCFLKRQRVVDTLELTKKAQGRLNASKFTFDPIQAVERSSWLFEDGGFIGSRRAAERGRVEGDVGCADGCCASLRGVLRQGERGVHGVPYREQGPAQMPQRGQRSDPVCAQLFQESKGQLQRRVHQLLDVPGLPQPGFLTV